MVAPWRLCRQCCCRYGCFPLLVVPIVTLGFVLSLYSSVGCQFVDLDIGFVPSNEGWDASEPYSFGALYYHNESVHHDSRYRESVHTGCVSYSDSFYDDFVDGDRTFKMIRIMCIISCASSGLAMLVSLIFVISPVPAGIMWPAVLLPSVMIAFISEGSKFLIFDTSLCRSAMWYRGSSPVPETAESCTMGATAWFACAAGVLHFWALVCVCLRAPERRTLHVNLGPIDKMEAIKEEQEATDDPDLDGEHSQDDSFFQAEEGGVVKVGDAAKKLDNTSVKRSFDFSDMVAVQSCDASDLPLSLVPIDTNNLDLTSGAECCSPLSEGKHDESTELLPDIPTRGGGGLSPVDCIIEGFDVATDLSQIDVCQTMMYSPTQKTMALESGIEAVPRLPHTTESHQSSGGGKMPDTTPDPVLPEIACLESKRSEGHTSGQGQPSMAPHFRHDNGIESPSES